METDVDAYDDISEVSGSHIEAKEIQEIAERASTVHDLPEYSSEEIEKLIVFIKKMTILFALQESDWNEKCINMIKKWLKMPNELLLTIFYDGDVLCAGLSLPFAPVYDLTYFLRKSIHQTFTIDGFHDEISFGTLHENIEESLLKSIESIYAPLIFTLTQVNDNIKIHLSSSIHNLLSELTGIHYKLSGMTVLYIPRDGLDKTVSDAVQDQEFLQRLETIALKWINAIRTCLTDRKQLVPKQLMCPPDEFDFWIYRFEILQGLQIQLNHSDFKHYVEILEKSQSIYIKQLMELFEQTEYELSVANDNVDFLQILIEPCNDLNTIDIPSAIPPKLGKIMHLIRVIWLNSKFFNTRKDITNLFRNLSNQIIIICQNKIDLKLVLEGRPRSGITLANMSIDCCLAYKFIYEQISEMHKKKDPKLKWDLDGSTIFNHIDAFVQRLYDFIEICETMIVFGRCDENKIIPPPVFGGNRGLEFERTCTELERKFKCGLDTIKTVHTHILDVHNNKWYDDIVKYRSVINELEEIVENLISNVFLSVCNVEDGIEALCSLHYFSFRKTLRPAYIRKTTEVWNMFSEEIAITSKILVEQINQRPAWLPECAGRAISLKINLERLERFKGLFDHAEWMIDNSHSYKILSSYEQLKKQIQNNIKLLFENWVTKTSDNDILLKLNRTLMCRSVTHAGLLECNIDRTILDVCNEGKHFEMLGFTIPNNINQIYGKSNSIKLVYESVVTVVLAYNKILSALSDKERLLFRALIRLCDRKIQPGIYKLTWGGELSDSYIAECVKHTGELQEFVDIYKKANLSIVQICERICDTPIMQIDIQSTIDLNALKQLLKSYRKKAILDIIKLYDNIVDLIIVVYDGFETEIESMTDDWIEYVTKFDNLIQEAILTGAKNSLQKLYNSLHGDGSVGPSPIFEMDIHLSNDKIQFSPSIDAINSYLKSLYEILIRSIKYIPRLCDKFQLPKVNGALEYYEIIERDDECQRLRQFILNEIQHNQMQIDNYLKIWSPFKMLWEIDKNKFMLKINDTCNDANSFNINIGRYKDIINQIAMQEIFSNVHFTMINSNQLKNSIYLHIEDWQTRFMDLLKDKSIGKITDLYNYMDKNIEEILQVPKSIIEMQNALKLYERFISEIPMEETTISLINDYFNTMDKYEIIISSTFRAMHVNLPEKWEWYLKKLKESEEMLDNSKDTFKLSLLKETEQFKNDAKELLDNFNTLPVTSNTSPTDALMAINLMRINLQKCYAKQAQLINDLATFNINVPDNLDLIKLDKELTLLEEVWTLAKEWENTWLNYKTGNFWNINADEMEISAITLFRRINRLSKQLKNHNWEIVEVTRRQIDEFRRTLPLLVALKNPSMKPRHWDRVRNLVQTEFDEQDETFNLDVIIEMDFQKFADEIMDISNAATMELQIEIGIKNIKTIWLTMPIEMIPFKDDVYRIKSVDDCFTALEDNSVQISSMKATRFVEPFAKEVDYWEKTLNYIMETLENCLIVQRQWLYLENIFQGPDIRKQLINESKEFDEITEEWKEITSSMYKEKFALNATHYRPPNYVLEKLLSMTERLELIQRALEVYLETKRQLFPRFYFISNDDLLEILGNAKKPDVIQPHMKKLFDNLNKCKLNKITIGKTIKWEAHGMYSDDGEYVEFSKKIFLDGPAEKWLTNIEIGMRAVLKEQLRMTRQSLRKMLSKRDKWLALWPGQLCLTSSKIQWTMDCTRSLMHCKMLNDKKPLKKLRKKQNSILNKLSEMSRRDLVKQLRLKVNTLITVEIHGRDVIDRMYKMNCKDVNHFEWFSQLRFYWDHVNTDCTIKQTNTVHWYGYEYTGNSGRLVITPLTDRCYITLTTALHLYRGGSPKGPAGTGKTETVKDLGKALGRWVIVNNCSEGLDYKSMGKSFSGLAQTGAWGCFDEFNRINIEVLSVVAQQILSILSALSQQLKEFMFEGQRIRLLPTIGLFITMNPGYAGRTELPDNLKSMFRPISMIVPDNVIIAENLLFSDGFQNTKILAKKVFTLYELAKQQLSKQHHYDFGLRSMVALLRYAGRKRRQFPMENEERMIYLAMKDMNVAKLTAADLPLFNGIISDIFPSVTVPTIDYEEFLDCINIEMKELGLENIPAAVTKVIQLYETKNSRHSVMILGATGTAKSTTWKVLKGAFSRMKSLNKSGWVNAIEYPVNPKALSLSELYGEYNLSTGEWLDGVLSAIMRKICADENPNQKWMLFDGPVDAVWIENMNSVMDDNKVLTLVNSERITMPEQVSLLFEVGDLSVASPATVSRCGMVYNDYNDWGWRPFVNSWLKTYEKFPIYLEILKNLFDRFFDKILEFKRLKCQETVPTNELNLIQSFCRLMNCLAIKENGIDVNTSDEENLESMTKKWFLFCMIWSLCGTVDENGRILVDNFIREMEGIFPLKDTVYDYFVDSKQKTFIPWHDKLISNWKYPKDCEFHTIIVPTIDTIRYNFIVSKLLANGYPVLLVGPVGTGKSSTAISVLNELDSTKYSLLTLNMSAQTTSNNVQEIIEGRTEKRTKGVYVPIGGKTMICFMDDLNMPAKEEYGSQPPLELIRQWIDYGFWYDREKQWRTHIKQMLLLAAMGPAGGGRQTISPRTLSRFNIINMTFPAETTIVRIFGTMIAQQFSDFSDEIARLGKPITNATIDLYTTVLRKMLPIPAKIHYLFNLRDISKIFQGLLRSNCEYHVTKTTVLRLWIHECYRVFSDRLIDASDFEWFTETMNEELGKHFESTLHNLCPNKQLPIFGDFISATYYEDLNDPLVLRKFMYTQLEEYNSSPGILRMDLVLFNEAIEHITRIVRVASQPRGHMLLIGIGGSGRQSLGRLASYLCDLNTFQIEVTKNYRISEFREDLKTLFICTGVERKPTAFLFNDTQVADENFMEVLNNMLSVGEVANLFKTDEFEDIKMKLENDATKAGILQTTETMYRYFIDRVRANLHIIICMSPIGNNFRTRIRQYPALINCTTIDWFREWPTVALLEVANKYLNTCKLDMSITTNTTNNSDDGETIEQNQKQSNRNRESLIESTEDRLRNGVACIFAKIHNSVMDVSQIMFTELKRQNYVTPTNYLELVLGFQNMLNIKRSEISGAANKLRNGLFKIDDTKEKVQGMSEELKISQSKVIEFQQECDQFLLKIKQETDEADVQKIAVSEQSKKIGEEEIECKILSEAAQKDLQKAMPDLEAATLALNSLNRNDLTEVKSYANPPTKVEKVMESVMILLGREPTWAEAKRQLSDQYFLDQLKNFDKNHISDKTLKRIAQYTHNPELEPDKVGIVSYACKSLCLWVRAIERYAKIYKIVAPKIALFEGAEASLKDKQQQLATAMQKLDELALKLERLQQDYNEKTKMKEELHERAKHLELKLERAHMLVDGLAGEQLRWIETVKKLDNEFNYLIGDCLVATAFISYLGPFITVYRERLTNEWQREINNLKLPLSMEFNIMNFLSDPTTIREWNIQGLPSDDFSTENGIIVKTGQRWPLVIDPQCQAHKWIKNMEQKSDLQIIDFGQLDYLKIMEMALQHGKPVLLQNIMETIDPALMPILNKALIKQGGQTLIKFNDKLISYDDRFRFFITTKLSNPHYPPEISTKTSIVNFAVKESGLQAQLLGIVVRKERPQLEEQKDHLVVTIAKSKRTLINLENEILRMLNESRGSLLDDDELFETLQTSKHTSATVIDSLATAEITEIEIDTAREAYQPSAKRAAILFFVLMDMSRIDPMYQFSLDAYIGLFTQSIEKSSKHINVEERIHRLNDYHTYSVYRNTCRGLFELHKLLFSFHMCARILAADYKLNLIEFNFLLKGGVVLDRQEQVQNPCSKWITDIAWDNITELDKLPGFHGVVETFEKYAKDWHNWYTQTEPESMPLIGEWESICNEFQRMLFIRCLRPDRITICVTNFIINTLGGKFVEPPVLDLKNVFEESTTKTPLIFVLSPGVDPTNSLLQLAETCQMSTKFLTLSLGQGQAPIATQMIRDGAKKGHWIFLANCHLSLSWMPELDKLIDTLQSKKVHRRFRLWLSSSPHPEFPISILQAGIKMTTEPPKGIKSNLKRLFNIITEDQFKLCKAQEKYKKLLFGLCFFHAILLERKKFQQLGWNIIYSFNDSDFEVSENILAIYLDEYDETPWDALKYLIAGVNYGGHVTDDWDRRLLNAYINQYFSESSLNVPHHKLSTLSTYFIPRDGSLHSYHDHIQLLPTVDHPEAFGQHSNADIASQIIDTRNLFETLLSVQVQDASTSSSSSSADMIDDEMNNAKEVEIDRNPMNLAESKVIQLSSDILSKLPSPIDYENTSKLIGNQRSPLDVILLQEIERYNILLKRIRNGLVELQQSIKGLIVMSTELEDIFSAIYDGRVPSNWLTIYSSIKPLGSWSRDLVARIEHFTQWAITTHPPIIFWLSAFTFPTGFLTAVLQTAARKDQIPIDALSWEFIVSINEDTHLVKQPMDGGVYVRGLYLEGAGWNRNNRCLKEPQPMELVCQMPTIHFKPVENVKKRTRGIYQCPCYYFPERSGSFVIAVDLKVGAESSDFWIKRGTALLLSLSD